MIEIEKKYRIPKELAERIAKACEGKPKQITEESNILYESKDDEVFRIRTLSDGNQIFTFKRSIDEVNGLKRKREIEFPVCSKFVEFLRDGLNLSPVLLYEKNRTTFHFNGYDICIDELPFGTFLEVEGKEEFIEGVEKYFGLAQYVEHRSYPQLTVECGILIDDVHYALFHKLL